MFLGKALYGSPRNTREVKVQGKNIKLLRGTLDLLILRALSWGALHGYAVAEWLERTTDGTLLLEEGTLYPALHRLERKGLIQAEWGVSENNRKARFYGLTSAGSIQMQREAEDWGRYCDAVAKVLDLAAPIPTRHS